MLRPPVVTGGGCPVGGALHIAVIGLAALARPGAAPPVLAVLVHLFVESVVHLGDTQFLALSRQVNNFKKIYVINKHPQLFF